MSDRLYTQTLIVVNLIVVNPYVFACCSVSCGRIWMKLGQNESQQSPEASGTAPSLQFEAAILKRSKKTFETPKSQTATTKNMNDC